MKLTYNPAIGAYVGKYDDAPPSVAITKALTELMGEDVTELNPLHEATALDVDALDDLFRPTLAGTPRRGGRVEFTYLGFEICVFSHSRIEIKSLDEDAE